MKHTSRLLSLVTGAAILSMAAACSSGSGNPTANDDAGNNAATGGAGAGGAGSTGGSTSVACPTTVLFNFDTAAQTQTFLLDNSVGTAIDTQEDSGKGMPYLNLAAPGDAGVVATPPELGWSGSQDFDSAPVTAGVMTIKATYSNWNQSVAPQATGLVDNSGNVIDFTNKIITFHVKITGDGLVPTNTWGVTGGGMVFLKTGSAYVWGQGAWTNMAATGWTALSINTKSPDQKLTGWDPSAPKQLGIQISSSGGGGSPAAPNLYGKANNALILIDYITVSCAP